MKIEEFRSLVKKRYGGYIKIIDDGTDKYSEDGHCYFRQIGLITADGLYSNYTIKPKKKKDKILLHDSRFFLSLSGGIWYIKNYVAAENYVDLFAKCVLEEILK